MFTQAELDQAGRLARAMASDIAIYNQEKIRKGLETDRLFEELEDDLREAFKLWESKINPEIVKSTNLLQAAIIDQVFAPHGSVHTPIF
ncbi:MAG: hypothetical protein HQ461_10400 [Deltaproteobacteria bacterium]|nr:hypothetical protein [Deltaproteobacteria bacterium]